jgi:hypothetical protein
MVPILRSGRHRSNPVVPDQEAKMAEQRPNQQDQRRGGYGDDAGGADPSLTPESEKQSGSNAAGRENPVTDAADADEALGNRTGGYGGNPPSGENASRD